MQYDTNASTMRGDQSSLVKLHLDMENIIDIIQLVQ
jgi:hypothetical protein